MTYQNLLKHSKSAALYSAIHMALEWDMETYMPHDGIQVRSACLEQIAGLLHKEKTSKKFAQLLSQLIDLETGAILDASLTTIQKASVREWRRDYLQAVKLPSAFVKKFAQTCSDSIHAWRQANKSNRFTDFLPHLKKIVSLCRQKADYLGFKEHPYDALLDIHEPLMTVAQLLPLFDNLKGPLQALIQTIRSKSQPGDTFLHLSYDHDTQLKLGWEFLEAMGFEKRFSRLDESIHPMSISLHPSDLRMTTRVYVETPMASLFSVLHEGGHALYSRNLNPEEFGSPICEPASLGINESQSRWWETLIGRSLPFWKHFYPRLQKAFPQQLGAIPLQDFYRAINRVEPSLIRVDADEVTYNLHIILRFELEKALIEGKLDAKEIPDAWNEKMQKFFSILPPSDTKGCLQDIHWSMGAIGYFPTYTLGNLYAAQFFDTFSKTHPEWESETIAGNMSTVGRWLKTEIHQQGRTYLPQDLCKKVTGSFLSEKPFLNYLHRKYNALYQVV